MKVLRVIGLFSGQLDHVFEFYPWSKWSPYKVYGTLVAMKRRRIGSMEIQGSVSNQQWCYGIWWTGEL